MPKQKKRSYVKRDHRKAQIYNIMARDYKGAWLTRREILELVGVAPSCWTDLLFRELVAERWLIEETYRQGLAYAYIYQANVLE